MNILLGFLWVISCIALWLFATSAKATNSLNNESNTFKVRSVAYWIAIVISFAVGFVIG